MPKMVYFSNKFFKIVKRGPVRSQRLLTFDVGPELKLRDFAKQRFSYEL